jgi:group I intron endonuclease
MSNSSCGIYAIIHLLSGKRYIGSTKNTKVRWRRHQNSLRRGDHHCSHLQRSWNKYGADQFEFNLIESVEDPKMLLLMEQKWMDSTRLLFNTCPRAGSPLGMKLTAEQRDKISIANSGVAKTQEHRAALSLAQHIRAQRPNEQKRIKKFAINRTGTITSAEHRAKLSASVRAAKAKRTTAQKIATKEKQRLAQGRECIIGGTHYSSINHASEMLGISKYLVKKRISI